jgi:hypothetical protein
MQSMTEAIMEHQYNKMREQLAKVAHEYKMGLLTPTDHGDRVTDIVTEWLFTEPTKED